MSRRIDCEICGQATEATTGTQRTCLSKKCRARLRSKTRTERYYESRPTPTCVWCNEPVLEARKRRYHDECRADKNRLRVQVYNRTHKIKPASTKARKFKGTVTCIICKTPVPRTGTRQVLCRAVRCTADLKNKHKREAKARRRVLIELRAAKQKKLEQHQPRKTDPVEALVHRMRF